MAGLVLYSTNVFLKHVIQREFRNDIHYVWCSEFFDAQAAGGAYSSAALIPRSSNPADIYRTLKVECDCGDRHSSKIAEQKVSLAKLARDWKKSGEITDAQSKEILYLVKKASFRDWRPVIYVIPREPIEPRLTSVPLEKRAGFGPEYIISDLKRSEFDIIEI
jgi:hypothetical protein